MTIKLNNTALRIRPSAVESFYGCAYQWGKHNLEGISSIPNSRAAIGTAIHAAAEQMWNECISSGKKEHNFSAMVDAANETFKEEEKLGMKYGEGENINTCMSEVLNGTKAFVEDIVPFTEVPDAVETFYKVDIEHPFVTELGGTVDYIGNGIIADIKTTKRSSGVEGYVVQQSIYKYLAEANGEKVDANLIQQVVMKKKPEGAILKLEPNIDYSKHLVNTMLDTLDLVAKDIAPIETILRGNPKYMYCSDTFCNFYQSCPFVKGAYEAKHEIPVINL